MVYKFAMLRTPPIEPIVKSQASGVATYGFFFFWGGVHIVFSEFVLLLKHEIHFYIFIFSVVFVFGRPAVDDRDQRINVARH